MYIYRIHKCNIKLTLNQKVNVVSKIIVIYIESSSNYRARLILKI